MNCKYLNHIFVAVGFGLMAQGPISSYYIKRSLSKHIKILKNKIFSNHIKNLLKQCDR